MKTLILGHGRHGKDTAAHLLAALSGMTFKSSSEFACDLFICDALKQDYGYKSSRECYNDRHNHRSEWFNLIKNYNSKDKARLCRALLKENDMYVGMRCSEEYEASRHLFDNIIYIDASRRKPSDDTMKIEYDHNTMIKVNNNRSVKNLLSDLSYVYDLIF